MSEVGRWFTQLSPPLLHRTASPQKHVLSLNIPLPSTPPPSLSSAHLISEPVVPALPLLPARLLPRLLLPQRVNLQRSLRRRLRLRMRRPRTRADVRGGLRVRGGEWERVGEGVSE